MQRNGTAGTRLDHLKLGQAQRDDPSVGQLMCRCGYGYHGVPETGGYWYTAEDQELLFNRREADVTAAFGRARSIYACPNCGALAVSDDGSRYRYFLPEPGPVRVFVDRSQTDALGGYDLGHPRSQQELTEQKIIRTPGLPIIVYDETGWWAACSVEAWVNPDDTLAGDRWVARPGGR
jgi:hypothetical protein